MHSLLLAAGVSVHFRSPPALSSSLRSAFTPLFGSTVFQRKKGTVFILFLLLFLANFRT